MSDFKQAGYSTLMPYLTVTDVAQMSEFYQQAFGFGVKDCVKDEQGEAVHAELTHLDAVVMIGKEGAHGSTSKAPSTSKEEPAVGIYLYCEDVDALFTQAVAQGAKVGFEPDEMFWGDRACCVYDPNGHQWTFATHKPA